MCIWIKWKKSKSIYLQGRQSCVSSAYPACLACHLGPVGDCSSVHVQGNTSMCWKSDLRWIATRVWSTDLKTEQSPGFMRVVAKWRHFLLCFGTQPRFWWNSSQSLKWQNFTTEHKADNKGAKDRLISNKDVTRCNGADRWWHVIISQSFCEYIQFLLLCLHQNA